MGLAVMTVEPDGNEKNPEFPRRVAASSRLWFHPFAC